MSIKILDCTLRDGSHINNGMFGKESIKKIIIGLVQANIELIEIGFLEDGNYSDNQVFFSEFKQVELFLKNIKKNNSEFGLMLRTDRCKKSKLKKIDSIDFVRIAFYQDHIEDVKEYVEILKDLGYKIYLNPIAISNYEENDIIKLLNIINNMSPNGVSIVDTFGSLNLTTFNKILNLFLLNLNSKIEIGLHLHENLSLSLSLSSFACKMIKDRNLIIDSSIQGMGRVPGNLPTELISSYLNQNYNQNINIDIIVDLAQKIIVEFKTIKEWGYNPIYMTSGILNIDRTYPEFFNEKGFSNSNNLIMQKMIKHMNYGKKFDSKHAEEIIEKFRFKIIIFDFDGTIINTNHKKESALIKVIADTYELDYNQIKEYIINNPGKNREYYFKYFLNKLTKSERDSILILEKVSKMFSKSVQDIYANADIESSLLELKNTLPDTKWYILSSANKEEIIKILDYHNILSLFDEIHGGPKTKYENYIEYISKFVNSNDEVLHIGDGNQDIELIEKSGIYGLLLTRWSMEKIYY